MIRQFLFGGAISAVNIGLHAMVMMLLIRVAQIASERSKAQASQHLVLVRIPTVRVLMMTHAARGRRPGLFRLRELHDARLRRRRSG